MVAKGRSLTILPTQIVSIAYLFLSLIPFLVDSQCTQNPIIFNFGDSNSDTGGFAPALGHSFGPPNGRLYFHHPSGRLCDGRLILDFLCKFFFFLDSQNSTTLCYFYISITRKLPMPLQTFFWGELRYLTQKQSLLDYWEIPRSMLSRWGCTYWPNFSFKAFNMLQPWPLAITECPSSNLDIYIKKEGTNMINKINASVHHKKN